MVIARVVDLATGAITDALPSDTLEAGPASTGVARGEFNPAWQPDGDLTVASLNLDGGSAAVSVGSDGREVETQTTETIDLPLGWSPDGEALAVRSVEGETPYEAGPSYVEVITGAGRARLSDSSDLPIVGWME
jgi:Tol biopolymer transport system component